MASKRVYEVSRFANEKVGITLAKMRLKDNLRRVMYCFFTDVAKYLHRCYFKTILYHEEYSPIATALLSSYALFERDAREDEIRKNPYRLLQRQMDGGNGTAHDF